MSVVVRWDEVFRFTVADPADLEQATLLLRVKNTDAIDGETVCTGNLPLGGPLPPWRTAAMPTSQTHLGREATSCILKGLA